MSKLSKNLIVIAACLVAVVGAGGYFTYVQQPEELELLHKAEKVAEMKRAEVTSLLAEYAGTEAEAQEAVRNWRARYKIIPDTLTSPEVLGYMNDLTQHGFETFDVSFDGLQRASGYSHYTLRATGRSYFTSLYRLVWELENSQSFYHVRDLTLEHIDLVTTNEDTGRERLQVMVSFSMTIAAIFNGPKGTNTVGDGWRLADSEMPAANASVLSVPEEVLTPARPEVNPFFPVIMEQIPPNTHGLIDVEGAELVSIVEGEGIFRTSEGYRKAGVGEDVYLGQIVAVDPVDGRVTARLNKGGLIDEVVLELQTGERYRQAVGPALLQPTQ